MSATTPQTTHESAARTILEQMKQKGGVKASAGEDELEEKERAMRAALQRDIKKRDGFFVVGDAPQAEEEEDDGE